MKKSNFNQTIVSERFTRIFALLVIVIGLIVLIGWFSRLMFLTRFSVNEVPMAPSTAYVFIFLAAGLGFYLHPQKIAITRIAAIASAVIAICLSCLLVITNLLKYHANWEHAFIKIPETQLSMQLGHMSLVTAILFIISGFALLFLLINRKTIKTFSIILTLIIFIISFVLLLAYAFGTPFFYFDNFIPPAVLTVLSFFLVSLALIAASDKNAFIVKSIWKTSTGAKLLRIFLPTTIAITVIESLIVIRILPLLNIHPAIGVSSVSLIVVTVVIVVISILSKSMGKTLDSALENLNESEERFRTISENAPVLINSFDEDGRCLFWNKQCNKTFGWTVKEINEHESAMALFYPDPAVCEEVIRTVASDSDGSFREWHPVTKDGKILSIMWANFSLPDGQVFSMGHDITERKQTEEALLVNQRRYKKAQAMGHVGNWEYDPLTTIFWASDEAKRIYGLDPRVKDFTTEDVENCIPEREQVHQALIELMEHHKKYDLVFDILTADKGIRKTIHSIAEIDRDAQGNPIKIIGVVNDITEHKQAEEALKRSEEFLAETNRIAGIGGWDIDLKTMNSRFTYETYRIYGLPQNQTPKVEDGIKFYAPKAQPIIQEAVQKAMESGTGFDLEVPFINAQGEHLWVRTIGKVELKEGKAIRLYGFIQDITERKLAEEKEKIHHSNIDLLSKTAMSFVEFPQDGNIYNFVGEQVREFVGKDSYIIVNSVDRESGFSTIESVLGAGKLAKMIANKLGDHPVGMKFDVEDPNLHYQDGKLHVFQEGLYGLLLQTIPKGICKSIEKLANINKIFVIDLAKKEQFFGSVIILLKEKTAELKNNLLIETFIKQASIAILKRQAEEALRINEDKLDLIFNSSPVGICSVDMLGNFITTNPAYEQMLGYAKAELVGLSFFDVTHPNDRPKNKQLFQDMFSLETKDFSMEKRYIRKDGEKIRVSVHAIGIRDAEGNIRFGTAFVDDITERKRAEEDLARTRTLLSETEKIGKIGGWIVNLETMIQTWTEETYQIHEVDIDFEPDLNKGINFYAPSSKLIIERAFNHTVETGEPFDLELELITAKGNIIWVNTVGKAQQLDGVTKLVSGSFQDITERKQIQETIMAKNKEMENYLYVTSHDLRTPLVNIQGFSQRLKKQADSIKTLFTDKKLEPEILHQLGIITDESIPKTLNFVLSNIEKMDALINSLLQLSRTGRVAMNIQKIDMNELFAKILQSLDFQIKETQCKIHIHPLPECYGDAALLDQLFANIISNALKYSDSERALEITVDAKKTYNNVVYTINDTGKGIAQKYLDKIWDVFYRIDPRSSKTGEGIGLSLVKRIAEKHKGKVWAESEENKGSVFHIELQNSIFTEI